MIDGDDQGQAFDRRLGIGSRPAVLVVDMCRAYFEAESPLFLDRPAVVDACRRLVEFGRGGGVPVIWTRVSFPPGGDGGVFYRKVGALRCFEEGNPLGEWIDGLEPHDGELVITKRTASAFFDTDLRSQLDSNGIDTVFVVGVSTSGCVRATALDACQSNIVPVVVADACGDRSDEIHQANLFDLGAKYADVMTLAEVVTAMDAR